MTARRRRPCRTRWPVIATATLGAALVLASVFLLFVTVPGKRTDARAFATAAACLPDEVPRECRKPVEAVVEKTATATDGRAKHHWLTLAEPGGPSRRVDMNGPSGVFGAVSAGDRVTATYWREEVRVVDFRGMRQFTADEPKEAYRLPFAAGLGLLALGGTLVWTSCRAGFRTGRGRALRSWQIALPAVAGAWLSAVGFGAPLLTDAVSTALVFVAAGAVPVVLGAVWRARVLRQRRPRSRGRGAPAAQAPAS
ncbi:hypothetical protein AB0F13_22005 [Streptomyces sp. NPDC026206]|uniref:hypothetical protein n=1 Tax=Streptomyces sp. NPDC026206 TaxID=3157089 RepID=UPI0033FBE3D8